MKTRYFLFLAALGLLASCTKEADAPQVKEETPSDAKTYLTVNLDTDTKTYLGSQTPHKVYWSNGDRISVNGCDSDPLSGLHSNTASVTFSINGTPDTPYNVLYPYEDWVDATHISLPAVQTYEADNVADKMLPLAGYSNDLNITLKHLCAIVKIQVKRATTNPDTDDIRTIRFSGRNGEKVSGSFEINYVTPALTPADGTGTDLVTRVTHDQSTETPVDYYLVVPAREYTEGFQVEILDVNGHCMTKKSTTGVTLTAGKLYNMPELEFKPTTTEVEISSASELIAFATDYNNKEYAGYGSSLRATLTDNISFTPEESDAFNTTGGIGTKYGGDNYFNGIFDGGYHTISGLKATVPLFGGTGGNGTIKNLILDSTCSFSFTHDDSAEGMFASIVGYHKGVLDNVKVAADIELVAVADIAKMTTVGGLTGRTTVGKLQNGCEYSGLISTPAGFTTTGKLIIGGLVGRFSNAGSVTGSYFKGAISNSAQVTSSDTSVPYLIIGGIVGFVDGGGSVSSSNSTADHADVASAYSEFDGKIVNKTTVAYNSAVGGIVGELNNGTVSNCTNAATIACSIYRSEDNCLYMKSGGIVGKVNANGTVTDCTNNGTVQHRSNPEYQDLGGIVGYNAGTISSCTNNAAVNEMTSGQSTKAGRYVYLGGVIGENVADNKVSDVHNTANIEISSMEDSTNSEERLGGVIGSNTGIIVGGVSKDITNSGSVYHSPTFSNQFAGYYIGGIVGLTTASIKNAKNVGRSNLRWNSNDYSLSNVYLGGIAGKASGTSSTIENCDNVVDAGVTNSAQVYLYLPGNTSYSGNFVGGIVGLTEATNPVKNCTNEGEVRTAAGASTVPVTDIKMGGIIGKMAGSGTVDNADNSGRVRINFAVVADEGESHHGNYLGGIIGYVTNESAVIVTGCDNSGQVDITNGAGLVQDHIASGVVGRMDASGSITNCSNNGGSIQMLITANSVGPKDLYCAGVLGYSESNIAISGCSNSGAISGGNGTRVDGTAYYTGGIVAYLKGDSRILNCSNTGSTVSTHAGNTDTIGSTALTGGIAGYVEGTSEHPIEIGGTPGCSVNTSSALNATRGWIAGVAAYAKYVQLSNCTVGNDIDAAARGAGGIVGKAENCNISNSRFNGDKIKANQIQNSTGLGGVVGNMTNSVVDGCYCYATKFYHSYDHLFGGIVGISNSNNTIQNCHYKSSVEGPKAGTAATATIAGYGSFANGGGNAADL